MQDFSMGEIDIVVVRQRAYHYLQGNDELILVSNHATGASLLCPHKSEAQLTELLVPSFLPRVSIHTFQQPRK